MNLSIDLNQEQSDVLKDVVLKINSSLPDNSAPYTEKTYLEKLILGAIDSYVKTAYENSLLEIGSAAAKLPYLDRKNLISQVKASISS